MNNYISRAKKEPAPAATDTSPQKNNTITIITENSENVKSGEKIPAEDAYILDWRIDI